MLSQAEVQQNQVEQNQVEQSQIGAGRQCIYFLTFFASGNRRVFKDYATMEIVKLVLADVAAGQGVDIFGFVIMPHHVHLLAGLQDYLQVKEFAGHFMSTTANLGISPDCPLWRTTYETVLITSQEDFFRKLHDIHSNPVRRHICRSDIDYPHSSALAWLRGIDDRVTNIAVDVKQIFSKPEDQ